MVDALSLENRTFGQGLPRHPRVRTALGERPYLRLGDEVRVALDRVLERRRSSSKADAFLLKDDVQNIVFDFEETRFMDSSGIGIIIGRYKKISCLGGKVYAIHADHQIRRILYVSGLTKVMDILEERNI